MQRIRHFISEIHRRSIWQVLAVYLLGAWIGYEVILALVEGLALPEWLPGLAIALFVVFLPIVIATAMVQEGAPVLRKPDLHLLDDIELAGDESDPAPASSTRADSAAAKESGTARSHGDASSRTPASSHGVLYDVLTWRNAFAGGVLAFALWGVIAASWVAFGGARAVVIQADSASAVEAPPMGSLRIVAEPAGAAVRILPLGDSGPGAPGSLGSAPATADELPPGEYLVGLEHTGHNPLELLVRVEADSAASIHALLAPAVAGAAGMVLVTAGPAGPHGQVGAPFLMDRHEVTNADYLEFMSSGGYQDAAYWPETLVLDGASLPRDEALRRLVDRTGIQAPRGWSGGIHPEGKAAHPVVGVTWYEAVAYLRWAGKELPSTAQWWRAAVGEDGRLFPWGDDQTSVDRRANFSLADTSPVGSLPAGLSPFGLADMAGNAREWLRDGPDGRKLVAGGSWVDPTYMFEQIESFAPGFSNDGIGLRGVRPLGAVRQETQ